MRVYIIMFITIIIGTFIPYAHSKHTIYYVNNNGKYVIANSSTNVFDYFSYDIEYYAGCEPPYCVGRIYMNNNDLVVYSKGYTSVFLYPSNSIIDKVINGDYTIILRAKSMTIDWYSVGDGYVSIVLSPMQMYNYVEYTIGRFSSSPLTYENVIISYNMNLNTYMTFCYGEVHKLISSYRSTPLFRITFAHGQITFHNIYVQLLFGRVVVNQYGNTIPFVI